MMLLDLMRRHRLKLVLGILALAALALWIYHYRDEWNREAVIGFGEHLPTLWFLVLFLVLPLAGFPVSVFLILAGIRFGFWGGMTVSAVAVYFHNLAAYRLTHGLFRARLRGFLERAGYGIPSIDENHRVRFTLLFAAFKGPPYFAKLYALALTDIPFRVYFFVGATVHAIFCAIPVAVGSAVSHPNIDWLYYLIGAIIVVTLLGYWLKHRKAARNARIARENEPQRS